MLFSASPRFLHINAAINLLRRIFIETEFLYSINIFAVTLNPKNGATQAFFVAEAVYLPFVNQEILQYCQAD